MPHRLIDFYLKLNNLQKSASSSSLDQNGHVIVMSNNHSTATQQGSRSTDRSNSTLSDKQVWNSIVWLFLDETENMESKLKHLYNQEIVIKFDLFLNQKHSELEN